MPHLWYLCFMYGDLLWPDLDLEPSIISNIYSISVFPYILGVLEVSFGPKLIILRSLRLVTWKPRFWLLTWPWPDTWPHLENSGDTLGLSHRELSNAASVVSLRPFVRELWRGGVWRPTPSASRGWRNTPANAGLTRDLLGGGGVKRLYLVSRVISYNSSLARHSCAKLWVAATNWIDHLLTKFEKYRTENFGAHNVLATSLHVISDPKVALVCESIKGKLLNGSANGSFFLRKMTIKSRLHSHKLKIMLITESLIFAHWLIMGRSRKWPDLRSQI